MSHRDDQMLGMSNEVHLVPPAIMFRKPFSRREEVAESSSGGSGLSVSWMGKKPDVFRHIHSLHGDFKRRSPCVLHNECGTRAVHEHIGSAIEADLSRCNHATKQQELSMREG